MMPLFSDFFPRFFSASLLSLLAIDVLAQRTDDNAVTQADDAFGSTIGSETIGLYSNSQVRGFSPVDAGNIRLEGLYFDRRGSLSSRLVESSTIRVGLSAQSYPFPAPTGIVDYRLRTVEDQPVVSIVSSLNAYVAPSIEIDASAPLIDDTFSLAGGVSFSHNEYYDGADAEYFRAAVIPNWQVNDALNITAFGSVVRGRDEEVAPTIVTAGSWLPPEIERRKYFGQTWADNETDILDYGIILKATLTDNWNLTSGIFRSENITPSSFAEIYDDTTSDGTTRELVIADPEQRYLSTSGEARLTRDFIDGERVHRVHVMVRGREQDNTYGGSAPAIDLGLRQLSEPQPVNKPFEFNYTERTQEAVSQWTAGLGYEGRWKNAGELSLGIQYTDYTKQVMQPELDVEETSDTPLLFNATVAAYLNNKLALYVGHTRGLEESGIAPDNTINRNEALPAIRTRQTDAGIRWNFQPDMKLVLGFFAVEKPYFTSDSMNRYTTVGSVSHRGAELSLNGALSKQWHLVAGAVFMQPEVSGYGVDSGRLGEKPVGVTDRLIRGNLEFHPDSLPNFSFDLAVSHYGKQVASNDGQSVVPAYTLLDLGARYRFKIGKSASLLRLKVVNVADIFTWKVYSNNSFGLTDKRHFVAQWTVDI